jgi:hypothetical protein
MVLFAAVLAPELLGPVYEASQAVSPPDTAIRVIALTDLGAVGGMQDPEWVDASRAALQQGPVRVQVASVSLGPLQAQAAPAKKKAATDRYLVIRLRAQQVGDARAFAAEQWHDAVPHHEEPHVTLTDHTGKVYQQRTVDLSGLRAGGVWTSVVFPVAVADSVFVFEPPSPGAAPLRLEVLAAAWGGSGVFRFTIPNSMIRLDGAPGR